MPYRLDRLCGTGAVPVSGFLLLDKAANANIKGLDIIKAITDKAMDKINQI
jgi:hypothetical protein